jgi:hypothetical protein
MAQRAGRITCPRCGANNFDTVTSCWKCGAPVGSAASGAAMPMPAPAPGPTAMPPSYGQERAPLPVPYSAPAPSGDTNMARRAALALALTLPFIGLPVGWIFMMIEDRNKQAVGRWCATWSLIGLLLHLVFTFVMIQNSVPFILRMLGPVMEGAARRNASGADGLPGGGGVP